MTILFAYDGSESASAAIAAAGQLFDHAMTPTRQASRSSRERRIARRAARWSVQTFVPDPVGRPGR
jgi:hypothetical protein